MEEPRYCEGFGPGPAAGGRGGVDAGASYGTGGCAGVDGRSDGGTPRPEGALAGTGAVIAGCTLAAFGSDSRAPPTSASVPEENCSRRTPGRSTLRITRGVMSSTTSVLLTVSSLLENRRPANGRSASPGTRFALRRSSSLMRPASTCVSPSLRGSVVYALRVPIWYAVVPELVFTWLDTLLTSRPILMPTSSSRNTCGSTSSLRPTSR